MMRRAHVTANAKPEAPGRLALVERFVNTLDNDLGERAEALADPLLLGRWLESQGLLGPGEPLGEPDLVWAQTVREALRAVLLAHTLDAEPDSAALAVLNEAGARASLAIRVTASGEVQLVTIARGLDGALGQLLAIVHEASHEGLWLRLKACHNPACRWAFFDRSKNQSGLWCTMAACGNKAKTRSYRSRKVRRDRW